MKIVLHIIEQLADFGGTPRKLLYLAAHHDPDFSRLIFVTYCPSPLKEVFERHKARVINLNTLSVLQLALRIARLARSSAVDVICTHYTRPLIAGFIASRLTGIPFIHNEHSSANYRQGFARRLAQVCMPFASAVICNSNHTAETIADVYHIQPSRLKVLYNPVESRKPTMSKEKLHQKVDAEHGTIVIGHIGGMIASRDQSTLLKAFQRIYASYPHARLWLIGDGPLRLNLEALAQELGIVARVNFLGYTDRVGEYLQGMDIYVNSTIDEGFGIAVVEAMLAGVPVVLADAGAHPELINDGEQGFLYKPGDVDALVNSLKQLIEQPQLRQQLAEAGQESAGIRFAPQRYVQGYNEIVEGATAVRVGRAMRTQRQVD